MAIPTLNDPLWDPEEPAHTAETRANKTRRLHQLIATPQQARIDALHAAHNQE